MQHSTRAGTWYGTRSDMKGKHSEDHQWIRDLNPSAVVFFKIRCCFNSLALDVGEPAVSCIEEVFFWKQFRNVFVFVSFNITFGNLSKMYYKSNA